MSVQPHDISDIDLFFGSTGEITVLPPRPKALVKRPSIRNEYIAARTTVTRPEVYETNNLLDGFSAESAAWQATFPIPDGPDFKDGESLTPIYDEMLHLKDTKEQMDEAAVRWTITSLRRMKVDELRRWVLERMDEDDARAKLIQSGIGRKSEFLDTARKILSGN